MTDDPTLAALFEAIALLHSGERDAARTRFLALWDAIGPEGDAFHRCVLAHYMADAQDDAPGELAWDLHALAAADALTQDRVEASFAGMTLASFYPSLHLNLAADYGKLGEPALAERHLVAAEACAAALPDTDLGKLTRDAIARLRQGRPLAG